MEENYTKIKMTGTLIDLISKVNSDWVILSVGKKKQHGHPSDEFIAAQSRHPNIKFLTTTEDNINLQIESSTGNIRRNIRMETGYGANSV